MLEGQKILCDPMQITWKPETRTFLGVSFRMTDKIRDFRPAKAKNFFAPVSLWILPS
jgi:hypothetical protein